MATVTREPVRTGRGAELVLLVIAVGLVLFAYVQVGLAIEGSVPANIVRNGAIFAALAVLGLLSRSGQKLSELAAPYRKYVNSPEINFEVADKEAMIERIKQEYSDGEIDELDGLTVNYDDWWFNIRASNTEPLLRLNVEADGENSLKDHVAHLKGVLSKKHD